MVSDYRTTENSTTIIIAAPELGQLFTTSSDFIIEEVIAATSAGEIMVTMPVDFGLSAAYPNPFNPSTSFNLNMSSTEMVSIDVYNVMGQRVDTIHNGELSAGFTHLAGMVQILHQVHTLSKQQQHQMLLLKK